MPPPACSVQISIGQYARPNPASIVKDFLHAALRLGVPPDALFQAFQKALSKVDERPRTPHVGMALPKEVFDLED